MRISRGTARRADKQHARNMDMILGWIECTGEHSHDPEWSPAVKAAARGLLDALTEAGDIAMFREDGTPVTPVQARFNAAVGAGLR